MSVSAALIVEDEAEHLDACLTSLRGLVDEIVVVDTGSPTAPLAVAERHGAVVGHEPWRGDFATPRNRSLDLATGDWILSVDADERVRGDLAGARAFLDRADACVAFRARVVPRVGWTPYREHRLWRNRSDIRFRGHIHESVVPAISAAAAADGLRVDPFDGLTIHHLGDEGDRARQASPRRAVARRRAGTPPRPVRSSTTISPACTKPPATAIAPSTPGSAGS